VKKRKSKKKKKKSKKQIEKVVGKELYTIRFRW
jgi:hypothetical protein